MRPVCASASARIAAVMPEPHVTPSLHWPSVGIPAARNTCSSSSGGRMGPPKPPCSTSVKGTLSEPGMWPDSRPGRGSGASPLKRGAARASINLSGAATADAGAPGVPGGKLLLTASRSRTSSGRKLALNGSDAWGGGLGSPVSIG
eukprot:scaffold245179_cov33-Tisochrysis_lutea.AAC.2